LDLLGWLNCAPAQQLVDLEFNPTVTDMSPEHHRTIPLSTTEVYVLINYTAFVEALFVTLSVAGMVWLRYKKPDLERPIKVNILLPITFLLVCTFLVTFPFYVSPWETGMGIAITVSGIPVYMLTIYWRDKPRFYKKAIGKVTSLIQKVLLSVPEEKND